MLAIFLASLKGVAKSFIRSSILLAVLDKADELSADTLPPTAAAANELFDDESVDKLDVGRISVGVIRTAALAPAPVPNKVYLL